MSVAKAGFVAINLVIISGVAGAGAAMAQNTNQDTNSNTSQTAGQNAAPAQAASPAQPAAPQPSTPTQVTVTGHRADVSDRIDRKVYDIAHDPDAQTGVASDVLNKLPSVQVSPAGAVTLRGDAGVYVMIDGKYPPQGNQIIQTLSAADIDRIEVMTNPSAQYAPDGTAGIINIITKKRHPFGFNGNTNLRLSSQGIVSAGLNSTLAQGPWSLDSRFSFSHAPYHGHSVEVRDLPEAATDDGRYRGLSESVVASVTGAYKPSDTTTLSLQGQDFRATAKTVNSDVYRSATLNYDGTGPGSFLLNQTDIEGTYEYNNDKTGSHFTLDEDHTDYRMRETGQGHIVYGNGGYDDNGSNSVSRGPEDDLKGDYERHLGNSRELTAGFEYDHHITDTETDYSDHGTVPGPVTDGFRDIFGVDRTVTSAYVTWQTPIGAWTVMPGLRAEFERRLVSAPATGVVARVSDLRWYPSLHVDHALGDTDKLKFSYSRRVQRPDLSSYDPGQSWIGLTGETIGNPYLRPTDTDSFELAWGHNKDAASEEVTAFYRLNSDLQAQVTTARADGYLITQPVNAGRSHSGGVDITLKGPLVPGWKYSINTTLQDIGLMRLGLGQRDYFSALGNAMIEYDSKAGDQVQANLTVTGKSYTVEGYSGALWHLDLSYQHPVTKTVALSVSVTDLTNSVRNVTVVDAPGVKSRTVRLPNDQALRIGLSYKFGTAKH